MKADKATAAGEAVGLMYVLGVLLAYLSLYLPPWAGVVIVVSGAGLAWFLARVVTRTVREATL